MKTIGGLGRILMWLGACQVVVSLCIVISLRSSHEPQDEIRKNFHADKMAIAGAGLTLGWALRSFADWKAKKQLPGP